ncbi:LysM peptidoglycan-binding domain-containing protein [Deinococcus aquaticus]|uniref:NlpC/P60 family protein n=1 Tax=Deinococcus aquaticus TaxID=328692 RepID=A0ABY7V5G2_9DEIO|nr:LysM peptidoglycan-binding domain-containing protein [Deinococcus aquaticus]WDA59122.1 NlpC/P60 family protein [Deinococcus aquaticus]
MPSLPVHHPARHVRRTSLSALLSVLLGASVAAAQGNPPSAGPLPGSPGAPATSQPAPFPADLRGLGSVTVQPGDTAFSLARRAGLSVETLLTLNGLGTPDLRVGQVLRLRTEPPAAPLHRVQSGETLYALARRYGVSVDALLAGNDLPPGTVLKVGQVLRLPAGAHDQGALPSPLPAPAAAPLPAGVGGSPFLPGVPPQVAPVLHPAQEMPRVQRDGPPDPASTQGTLAGPPARDWREAAMTLLGTPYRFGGETPGGTDCSGFVRLVFTPLGVNLPRVSADQAQAGRPVADRDLLPGDLLFFDTEGQGRVSHVGIYLGGDEFVSANSYQGRVSVDRLHSDRYWGPRYLWARRVLEGPAALAR